MGYLLPILIAFGSLAYGEFGLPVGASRPWAILACLPIPYLFGALDLRIPFGSRGAYRWLRRLLNGLERAFPVLLQFLSVGAFGWLRSIQAWFGVAVNLEGWPTPELVFALGPFILGSLATIDSHARKAGPVRAELRTLQVRMFLTALCPIIGYVFLTALVGSVDLLRLGVQMVSLWGVFFTLGLVLLFALVLPYFLRVTWDTEPMGPGPKRDLLLRVGSLAKFRCRELLLWRTGNLMANAAIVGVLPGTRRVFFTDELLARMGPRQLAAVYAHEIGHAKRHHVLIFMAWSVAVFAGLDALMAWLDPSREWMAMGFLVLGLVAWMLAFGWLSRRIELQADLFSLELLNDGVGICDALRAVSGPNGSRGSWRHFSTDRRVQFMQRVMDNPLVGKHLHRQIARLAILGVVLACLGGGTRMIEFSRNYPMERAALDLGLGRYDSAVARLEGRTDAEALKLAQLATLALEEGLGQNGDLNTVLEATLGRADRELRGHQLATASAWLTLASYSGDVAAGTAAHWLLGLQMDPSNPGPIPEEVGPWMESLLGVGSAP